MFFLILILLFLNTPVYAENINIKEQDIDDDGAPEIVIRNNLIEVVISPKRGGRIFSYNFKDGKNLISKNWGLISDHPGSNPGDEYWGVYREKEYSYEIEKDIDGILVKLTLKDDTLPFNIKKIIKIKDNDTTLTILHKFLRKAEKKDKVYSVIANFFEIYEDAEFPWVIYLPFKNNVIPMGGKKSDERIKIPFLSDVNAYHKFKTEDLKTNEIVLYNPNYDISFIIRGENLKPVKLATGIDNSVGYLSCEFHFIDNWETGMFKSYIYTINISKGCPVKEMENLVKNYKESISEQISFEYEGKKPVIEGSFVQAWEPVCSWSEEQWMNELKMMKALGMNILIIQSSAINNMAFYPSKFLPMVGKNYIEKVMKITEKLDMKVILGLYMDNTWWAAEESKVYLQKEAVRNKKIANELYTLFGSYRSFDGWYIPHEISDASFRSEESRDRLAAFISDIALYCKKLTPGKKVSIAPFYANFMSISDYKEWWEKFLQKANVDIVMLQDGVGVNGEKRLKKIPLIFGALKEACVKNNVDLWSDLEVFVQVKADPVWEGVPAGIDRVIKQLTVTAPYVSRFVIFSFNDYMSPQKDIKNKKLYEGYKKYYEEK